MLLDSELGRSRLKMSRQSGFVARLVCLLTSVGLMTGCRVDTLALNPTPVASSVAITAAPEGAVPVVTSVTSAGTGGLEGQILWNGEGAAGLEVRLCQEPSLFRGCSGAEYLTWSVEDGSFSFAGVPAGDYGLSVRVFNSDRYLFVTSGLGVSVRIYHVENNRTLSIGAHSIHKLDLQIKQPAHSAQIQQARPSLEWVAYPDAAYYQVYLAPDSGEAVLVNARSDEPRIDLPRDLMDCEYRWKVSAFNSAGTRIAETADYARFLVSGQGASCLVHITDPLGGATVDAGAVVLAWEDHPLASYYTILLWNDSDPDHPKVLDFVQVRETRYVLPRLDPARYVWSVNAYDAGARRLASSKPFDFVVRTAD